MPRGAPCVCFRSLRGVFHIILVDGAAHLDSHKDEQGEYHNFASIVARQIRLLDRPKRREDREPGEDQE